MTDNGLHIHRGFLLPHVMFHVFRDVWDERVGYVLSGVHWILRDQSVRKIDITYTRREKLGEPSDSLVPLAAELCIEVFTPKQPLIAFRRRAHDYLAHGAQVWLLFSHQRSVELYRPDQPPQTLNVGDTLAADAVVPGLRVSVADLFKLR